MLDTKFDDADLRKINKRISEISKKIDYCSENGHVESKENKYFSSGAIGRWVHLHCSHCNMPYSRRPNTEESQNIYNSEKTPVTI